MEKLENEKNVFILDFILQNFRFLNFFYYLFYVSVALPVRSSRAILSYYARDTIDSILFYCWRRRRRRAAPHRWEKEN